MNRAIQRQDNGGDDGGVGGGDPVHLNQRFHGGPISSSIFLAIIALLPFSPFIFICLPKLRLSGSFDLNPNSYFQCMWIRVLRLLRGSRFSLSFLFLSRSFSRRISSGFPSGLVVFFAGCLCRTVCLSSSTNFLLLVHQNLPIKQIFHLGSVRFAFYELILDLGH